MTTSAISPAPRPAGKPEVVIIAAVAQNGAIGFHNRLLFRLRADMRRFKALTVGHTVLMGRKTFESLPKGALPQRRNLVVSRNTAAEFDGCETFTTVEAALASCKPGETVFVIGGASIYAATVNIATRMLLTCVHATPSEADVFFPPIDATQWKETARECHKADAENEQDFDFVDYERA